MDFSTSVSCASANVLFYTCDDPAVLTLNDVPYLVHEKLGCGASADVYRVELLIPRFTRLKFGEDGEPVLDENFRLVVEIVGEEDKTGNENGAGGDADEDGTGEEGVEDDAEKKPSGTSPNSPPCRRSTPSSKDRDQSGLRQFQPDQEKRCVSSTQREPEAERSSSVILGGGRRGRAAVADATRDRDCAACSDGGTATDLHDERGPRTEADIDDSQLVPSGASYALKIVHLPADSPDQTEQLRALHAYEISLLSQLRECEGIVHIYDSEVREKAILILLELAVCDFGTWLHEPGDCEKGGVRSLSPWDVLGIYLFRFVPPPWRMIGRE